MIKARACERQIIAATQSPLLADAFGLDEFFVLDMRPDGRTGIRRLDPDDYRQWLDEDYAAKLTTGELWQKNLFGDSP